MSRHTARLDALEARLCAVGRAGPTWTPQELAGMTDAELSAAIAALDALLPGAPPWEEMTIETLQRLAKGEEVKI